MPSADELCDAFFHIKETPEAGVRPACLRELAGRGSCSGKTTCLVACLVGASGEERHLRLYRNAARQSCAEGFLFEDSDLVRAIEVCQAAGDVPATLRLYLTQQPCHFSSSHDANSCTESLIAWHGRVLRPRGVARMRILAAYPYRTHWDASHMSDDDLATLGRRKWARGGGCTQRGCPFRHRLLPGSREEQRAERARRQRDAMRAQSAAGDPYTMSGSMKQSHAGRHIEFARFLAETFGVGMLRGGGDGVVDVAGGDRDGGGCDVARDDRGDEGEVIGLEHGFLRARDVRRASLVGVVGGLRGHLRQVAERRHAAAVGVGREWERRRRVSEGASHVG